MSVFRRTARAIERFNRWLAPAALGSSVEPGGGVTGGSGSAVNAMGVEAVLGEIEADVEGEEQPETNSSPRS